MIQSPHVFRDDHLPRGGPLHRDAAIADVCRGLTAERSAFAPASDRRIEDLLIAGPSGVGKTLLARHAVDVVAEETGIHTAYVPALGQTDGDILRDMIRQHPGIPSARITGNRQVDTLLGYLRDDVDDPYVVILDEADDVPDQEVLGLLDRLHPIAVVAISHDADRWLARAGAEASTRFRTIHLDRYGVDELGDILERRAREGLRPFSWSRGQLEQIADAVAGVARRGIQSLRAAAELASERDHSRIRDVDVDDSFERAQSRIRELNIQSLPFHHQVLYGLIRAANEEGIGAGELHERYDAISDTAYQNRPEVPLGKRARRNKVQKLLEYDLVQRDGPDHNLIYRAVQPDLPPAIDIAGIDTNR